MIEELSVLGEPEFELDKFREIHFEYVESLGGAHKTIKFTTYLTASELFEIVGDLVGRDENHTDSMRGAE